MSKPYISRHPIRIVTAASLFDGHDAAINVMRRILQASGAEVIHLGHNRSVGEIVECAIEEDAQGIAMTSYQGGHVEYMKYMYDLLKKENASTKIFGGGGGTILPTEIDELHQYGISRIYSPDDGRSMGLQGMINHLLEQCDFSPVSRDLLPEYLKHFSKGNRQSLAKLISLVENHPDTAPILKEHLFSTFSQKMPQVPVIGITGTGGSGKSSLIDEMIRRYLDDFQDKKIAVISVDPSKRKTGGALLGDRIRMNSIYHPRVFMRSLATRESHISINRNIGENINLCKAAGFDLIILETSGIGQSDSQVTDHSDICLYVMTSEYGAATQLEKIDMLDYADLIAINKFDKPGSLDALRDVRRQYRRNHQLFDCSDELLPIFGTKASLFNDPGTNIFYTKLVSFICKKFPSFPPSSITLSSGMTKKKHIIPPDRTRYLAEISHTITEYHNTSQHQVSIARSMYQLDGVIKSLEEEYSNEKKKSHHPNNIKQSLSFLREKFHHQKNLLDSKNWKLIEGWCQKKERYSDPFFTFKVRNKEINLPLYTESLSHTNIPKISLPKCVDWGDILQWQLKENVPGEFPFTAGVFPLKRDGEDPARMFAGEGCAEQTNKRFHYVSSGSKAKRLSTAFDSVTLYGEDPDYRPDIYGKIGNSGVSIFTLDEAKKLYSGFNLADPLTSVSLTINGPAPIILGFFLNAVIDQQCEIYIKQQGLEKSIQAKIAKIYDKSSEHIPNYRGHLPDGNDGLGLMLLGVSGDQVLPMETYGKIRDDALKKVRGTVQADILKEDQAQNTCIFSTEFALKFMGDIQEYFIRKNIRNFYSVSISGYHIAEAGANPITQLAFTLANGFTFVEYYHSRGMDIDDFAQNLSFFFSNGVDPEYAVLGRVARRIWSIAMKHKYGVSAKAQKLKYHIQTSGRSLHAQEISFNDIRTTLQALYALVDNCNSLHTNAYDEAITTPTEESVRRAMAIQLIINKELGLMKNENPFQGSFFIEHLTDLVENAVLEEFKKISDRGGVLGAMERMYQRSRIQEESMYYETLKHQGKIPIIGVNTFQDSQGSPTEIPRTIIRSAESDRNEAIRYKESFIRHHKIDSTHSLMKLTEAALNEENLFTAIMEATKNCTLGQISDCLYKVGGQYRRNI